MLRSPTMYNLERYDNELTDSEISLSSEESTPIMTPSSEEPTQRTQSTTPSSVKHLINEFYRDFVHIDEGLQDPPYNLRCNTAIDPDNFKAVIEEYLKTCPLPSGHSQTEHKGFSKTLHLEDEDTIFVRADLHGDLKSLLENLLSLQKEGILDENFKIKEELRGKVKLIFLGDYVDRGPDSLKIIQLLCQLKIENGDDIVILKGNHEDTEISLDLPFFDENQWRFVNRGYIDPDEKLFVENNQLRDSLELFFQTLPIFAIVGVKNEEEATEYVACTHALFDLQHDLSKLYRSKNNLRSFKKLKTQKIIALPKRVRQMTKSDLNEKDIDILKNLIANPKDKELLEKVFALLDLYDLKEEEILKLAQINLSAYRVSSFINANMKKLLELESFGRYGFLWSDIENTPSVKEGRGIALNDELIDDILLLNETKEGIIKYILRGHQHWTMQHNKAITLPAGGELLWYDKKDMALLFKVSKKVSDWKVRVMQRKKGASETEVTPEMDLISKKSKT